MKETEIVPIAYMPGTGGNFLADFITHAKSPIRRILSFSTYGNSHENSHLRELRSLAHDIEYPDGPKIKYLLEKQRCHNGVHPIFYPAVHISDSKQLVENFEKVIKITYDEDDYTDLTVTFIGKFLINEVGDLSLFDNPWKLTGYVTSILGRIYYFNTDFKPNITYDICYVSWKDLFVNPIPDLIENLSNYTNIPKENFTIDFVEQWRNKTKYGISEVRKLLVENNIPGTRLGEQIKL